MGYAKRQVVPAKVKVAIAFLIEQSNDVQAAAAHAGISLRELKRYMGLPQCRRYSLEQRQIALERFCLGSPAALTKVRDTSENGMAVVASVKTGELLRLGALHDEATAQKRQPGLSIVLIEKDGGRLVAYEPPQMQTPMIDVTPAPQGVPLPVIPSDADAE
jgi:hypothetical protein